MSKKDVDFYFNQICNDYHELMNTLHDMEEEASKGLLDPDKLIQMKEYIEPIKINWQRLSYIMFLLNKPCKKQKHKKYINQNKKLVKENSTLDDVHNENIKYINKIKTDIRTS